MSECAVCLSVSESKEKRLCCRGKRKKSATQREEVHNTRGRGADASTTHSSTGRPLPMLRYRLQLAVLSVRCPVSPSLLSPLLLRRWWQLRKAQMFVPLVTSECPSQTMLAAARCGRRGIKENKKKSAKVKGVLRVVPPPECRDNLFFHWFASSACSRSAW